MHYAEHAVENRSTKNTSKKDVLTWGPRPGAPGTCPIGPVVNPALGIDDYVGRSNTTLHVVTYLFSSIAIASSNGIGTRINVEKNDKTHLEI